MALDISYSPSQSLRQQSGILLQPSLCQRPSPEQASVQWGPALAGGGVTLLKGLWLPFLIIIGIKLIKNVIERYANLRK